MVERRLSLLGLYLVWGGIGLNLAATLYDPAFTSVSQWFERQRVRALTQAVAPVGAGIAYDALRSYELILWAFAAISALAVLAVLPAKRTPDEALQSEP